MEHRTFYRTTQVDGLSIFYREAGPKDASTLLLLHGFPSSSRMIERICEFLRVRPVAVSEARVIGRDEVIASRKSSK